MSWSGNAVQDEILARVRYLQYPPHPVPLGPKHLRVLSPRYPGSKQRNSTGSQMRVPTMVNGVDFQPIQLKEPACDRHIADKVERLHGTHCTKAILLLREVTWLRPGEGQSVRALRDDTLSHPHPTSAPTAPTYLAWLLCALANSGALPIAYPLL